MIPVAQYTFPKLRVGTLVPILTLGFLFFLWAGDLMGSDFYEQYVTPVLEKVRGLVR